MNWATASRGAKLVDYSSQLEGCDAANVLDENISNIWLSENGAPQWLCISLAKIKDKDSVVIRTIGWHCWHSYLTNPKLVSMHVSSDGAKFKLWDSFISKQTRGTQLFSCAPVDTSIYPYIALEVAQTFGGAQTYMNRVFLYSDEVTASPASSKDGARQENRSESSSSIESPEVHLNNLSDLSAMSLEHSGHKVKHPPPRNSIMASQDTDQLVEQLQDALGLGEVPDADSSYAQDDHEYEGTALGATYELHSQSPLTPGSATVAQRLAHLETTVNALGHTVIEHYSKPDTSPTASSSASPSQSRHQTPRSRSRTQSHSTPSTHSPRGSSSSSWKSPARLAQSPQPTPSASIVSSNIYSAAPLDSVYQRMHSLEQKFSRLLDVLEERQQLQTESGAGQGVEMQTPADYNAQRRPQQPPTPPPPPAPPSSAHTLASNTSISNVTSSSKSQRLHFDPSLQSPRRHLQQQQQQPYARDQEATRGAGAFRASSSDPAVERVVHSIETMVDRVWDKYHHQRHRQPYQRQRGTGSSPVRPSAGAEPTGSGYADAPPGSKGSAEKATSPMRKWVARDEEEGRNYHNEERMRAHAREDRPGRGKEKDRVSSTVHDHRSRTRSKDRSRSSSRGRDRGEHRYLQSHEEDASDCSSGDSDVVAGNKGSGLHKYVSSNTERLLRRERVRQLIKSHGQSNAHSHTQPNGRHGRSTHHHHSRSRSRSPGLVRSEEKSNGLSSSSNSSTDMQKTERHHRAPVEYAGVQADSVLERSIFELLKSKYGLDAGKTAGSGAGPTSAATGNAPGASTGTSTGLPMRAPAEQPAAAVVDWPQYVHNRVASRSSVTGELAGAAGGGGSPLRPGVRGVYTVAGVVVNNTDNMDVLPRAKQEQRNQRREREQALQTANQAVAGNTSQAAETAGADAAAGSHVLPDWCAQDPEIAELVRALHHKVYQRTIKEAQYEMLIDSHSHS